jgi:hypothetical protein
MMAPPGGAAGALPSTSRKERELKRLVIAGVGVCLVGGALIAGSATGQSTVYAPKDCTTPKVEPKRITLTCGDAGTRLKSMGWNSWNTSKVKGQGKLLVEDCDPNCAEGGVDRYKVKATLLNIKNYTCGGQTLPMYRRVHLRFPSKKPPNKGQLKSFPLLCN